MSTLIPAILLLAATPARSELLLGEEPALGPPAQRVTQAQIEGGHLSLHQLRAAGMTVFGTAFRKADGFGDGTPDPLDTLSPGGRPTLQGNGAFLRVNGLDAQSCVECHGIVSTATVPFVLGVGGAGGISTSPLLRPRTIDVSDSAGNGFAAFDGRLINPPALFGSGGVELVAKEMTARLQQLKARALAHPGTVVELRAKGVNFGTIVADHSAQLDTSAVEGVDEDLVVRPFGRKGEFASVRQFNVGALMFHAGMQPVEIAGAGVDADDDGVSDEVRIGEVSALGIFLATQDTPYQSHTGRRERRGLRRFRDAGCADCHRPVMNTRRALLTFSFPEIDADPAANVFYAVDLLDAPMHFAANRRGGVQVPMFSDLKRHDMGPALGENFHGASGRRNREFITAKLWGAADTAPYLHDGRALTLNDAIVAHDGEAATARQAYQALGVEQRNDLLSFLRSLRNPPNPNQDVVPE